MIYFDNAATTPLAPEVLESMMPYMEQIYGNPSSIHGLGRKARAAIEQSRRTIANLINASIGEIFFTSGGTESNNLALIGAVRDLNIKRIITSSLEHHCILHCAESIEKERNTKIDFVKLLENGHIDLVHLRQLLEASKPEEPTLVSLMYGNNEIGNLLDIQTVANLCEEFGALFHTDTVQTFGYYPIDVQQTKIAFLSGSAHKLHGPKGVGFIYINSDNMVKPLLLGGSQERNMRAGTENVMGIVGLAKAAELAYARLEEDRSYITDLKAYLIHQIQSHIPNTALNGDPLGQGMYKVVNIAFPPSSAADLLLLNLDISGICASGGSACSSGVDVGSHVLEALKIDENKVNIRFSFSRYNTKKEVDILIKKLLSILKI